MNKVLPILSRNLKYIFLWFFSTHKSSRIHRQNSSKNSLNKTFLIPIIRVFKLWILIAHVNIFILIKFLTHYALSIMDIIIKKKKKKNNPRSNAQKRSRAWPVFFARRKNRRFPGEYFIPARIYARVNEWQAKSPGVMKSCNLRGKCARVITSMLAWFVIVVENISLCKGCSCLLEKNNPRFERLVDHPSAIRISECKKKKKEKKKSLRDRRLPAVQRVIN